MKLFKPSTLLAAFLLGHGAPAAVAAPLWEVGAGVAALHLPQYRGADRSHNLLLPLPYLLYRGPVLKADREGLRATLAEQGDWQLNLSAALSPPVDSADNPARAGMPRLATTGEVGPDLVWRLSGQGSQGLSFHWPLRAAVTMQRDPRAVGWVSTPHLQWNERLGAGWQLGLRGGAAWASRRYHEHFYGVAPVYATAQRPAYAASAGSGGLQAMATLSRRVDRLWFGAYVQADSLRGSTMADSPLVRRQQGLSVGVAMAWVFARSTQQVSDLD